MTQMGPGFEILNAIFAAQQAGEESNKRQLENLLEEEKLQKARLNDPMDLIVNRLQAAKAQQLTNPDYLKWYENGLTGSYKSQDAAGRTAQLLQPFTVNSEQAKLENEGSQNRLFGNMYKNIEKQYDNTLPEDEQVAGAQRGIAMADTLSRVNPKAMSQERMLDEKLSSADILNQRNNDTKLALAQMTAQAKQRAVAGDKTAQQALITMWGKQVQSGEITQAEYGMLVADLQSSINAAKVQPGITPVVGADGNINIGNKQTQQPVQSAPNRQPTESQQPAGKVIKYDSKGNRIP
jgi:hypothetical protein